MKSSFPEVPSAPSPVEDKDPPPLLKAFIWSSAVLFVGEWAADYGSKDFLGHLGYTLIFGLCALLWLNLWRGRRWARYVTIVYAFGFVVALFIPLEQTTAEYVVGLVDTVLNVALLIYLLTPTMRRHFSRHEPLAQ